MLSPDVIELNGFNFDGLKINKTVCTRDGFRAFSQQSK